jgi:hypothetical protein
MVCNNKQRVLCELYDKIHPTINSIPTFHENFQIFM